MSQWKGYGPDNVLGSQSGVTESGPQSPAGAGSLTYEPYYGLKAKPFSLSTDPRTLYKSPVHNSVLESLLGGIRRREGLIVLTGEMGTGKTTLCRAALYQLDRKTFTTFVPDPFLSREDLLRMLLVDFGEVSVDDLRRGRLSGASRPDLSYQLYEFLTSLESVDAFAVLVIDEAQHLAPPLLEEIRALSELEAGRRLLQIVLVGQPELQLHLKEPHMRHIDQRVTLRCELYPLTKEDVADYVAHRLATAGGSHERVAFASTAIEMIHAASKGVPRLVNVICDRALAHGHSQRTSVIGPPLVASALDELKLAGSAAPAARIPEPPAAPLPPSAAQAAPANRRGLFETKPASATEAAPLSDLSALLDLPPMAARREWDMAREQMDSGASSAPAWKWRVDSEARRHSRFAPLRAGGLAVLGMGVMLVAGGMAVTAQRARPANPATAPTASASTPTAAPAVTAATVPARATVPAVTPTPPPQPATPSAASTAALRQDTWIVQVAAFSSPERSLALVHRLTRAGLPAFEMPAEMGARGVLHFVRVGPFKTAAEADDARLAVGQQAPEVEGAFVRNVTTSQ